MTSRVQTRVRRHKQKLAFRQLSDDILRGRQIWRRVQSKNMKQPLRNPNSNIAIAYPLEAMKFPSSRRQKHYRFFIRDAAVEGL
jgi:hypothetical protein